MNRSTGWAVLSIASSCSAAAPRRSPRRAPTRLARGPGTNPRSLNRPRRQRRQRCPSLPRCKPECKRRLLRPRLRHRSSTPAESRAAAARRNEAGTRMVEPTTTAICAASPGGPGCAPGTSTRPSEVRGGERRDCADRIPVGRRPLRAQAPPRAGRQQLCNLPPSVQSPRKPPAHRSRPARTATRKVRRRR